MVSVYLVGVPTFTRFLVSTTSDFRHALAGTSRRTSSNSARTCSIIVDHFLRNVLMWLLILYLLLRALLSLLLLAQVLLLVLFRLFNTLHIELGSLNFEL